MSTVLKVDVAGLAAGWFDETSDATGWFDREIGDTPDGPADETPGNACMSLDVCVEGLAQPVEYYATDEIQGTQAAPLHDFFEPPDESVLNTSIPDYLVDEMFEPGVFWFQTGPPTALDDETGQTRGQTCLPDYLEPDDQLDPSDADWQNPAFHDPLQVFDDPRTGGAYQPDWIEPQDEIGNEALTVALAPPRIECVYPNEVNRNGVAEFGTTQNGTLFQLPELRTTPLSANAGGIQQRDLYVVWLIANNSPGFVTVPPVGWDSYQLGDDGQRAHQVFWRFADGTEGAQPSITVSGIVRSLAVVIRNADYTQPPAFGVLQGASASTSIDPATITAPWGAAENLFFVAYQDVNGTVGASPATPTGYTSLFSQSGTENLKIAFKQSASASDDPSAITISDARDQGVFTFVIKGNCGGELEFDTLVVNVVTDVPTDLELEDEPTPEGWQRWPLEIDPGEALTFVNTSVPEALEPEAEVDSDGWQHPASDDGPVCTFPAVVSVTAGNNLTSNTVHVVSLPTVSIGDLAVVVFGDNGNTHTATAGWTEVVDNESVAVYSRVIDGSEGGSMTITSSATTESVWYVYRIAAGSFDPLTAPVASTLLNSTAQDPDPLTGWADKTLVLAAIAGDTATSPITFVAPANMRAGFVGQETGGTALPDAYLAVAWDFASVASIDVDAFSITPQSSDYDLATIAIRGACPLDLTTPGGHEFPADLEPEAEVDTEGWRCAPLEGLPLNDDISDTSVPADLEPEAEVDTNGWFSAPLHDTPSTDDITETAVPVELLPDDQVDCDGWAFRLPDMEAAPVAPPDPGVSVGTLPGHVARRKWWVERVSKTEKAKRERGEGRWPNLPEPKNVPYFKPKVVTSHTVRPRLEQINRDWKIKMRKVRDADDAIIAAIIASILSEGTDDNDS